MKGLHLSMGQEAWGHVVTRLLEALGPSPAVPNDLVEKGRVLDNYYIPARYPNGHPEGAAFEHFGPLQSEQAIGHAGEILDFVRSQMA